MISKRTSGLILLLTLFVATLYLAADSLPSQLSDDAFWKLIADVSEADGSFAGENYVSNEPQYASVLAELQKTAKPGGVYIGVGPEQNFNYIAATRPKMAFIIDIRRQNALEHLMYRALFEMSADRAAFLSRLFSRERPAGLSETSSVTQLMDAYWALPENTTVFDKNLQDIRNKLSADHGFALADDDFRTIAKIYKIFSQWGAATNYASDSAVGARIARGEINVFPTFSALMKMTDSTGKATSFMANEESYRFVRDLEMKGLVVPVTGDFAGPKAIRAIGQYLKDHNVTVSAFYVSNVETYLLRPPNPSLPAIANGGWKNYMANVAMLPIDDGSVFLRWPATDRPGQVDLIKDTLRLDGEGKIKSIGDLTTNRR